MAERPSGEHRVLIMDMDVDMDLSLGMQETGGRQGYGIMDMDMDLSLGMQGTGGQQGYGIQVAFCQPTVAEDQLG